MSNCTVTRSSVLVLAVAAALSLPACGKKDDAATPGAISSSNTTMPAPAPAASTATSSTAPAGNSTDTSGSASSPKL